jgi:hypothetical protein
MNAKEHFAAEHAHHIERAAHELGEHEEHVGLAKDHHAIAEQHDGKLAELHKSVAARHERLAGHHKAAHERHIAHAAHFKAMHDGTSKTAIPDDIEKARRELAPTDVHKVTPGIRAIPREGGPPLQAPAKPHVPAEFAKVFEAGENQETDLYGAPAL